MGSNVPARHLNIQNGKSAAELGKAQSFSEQSSLFILTIV